MTAPRARWLAARTRNAARHGLIIAGVGTIAMIATLLTFVLLPRQADRALSNALAALPPMRDTVALLARRAQADSQRAAAVLTMAQARGRRSDEGLPARDTALRDLALHLERVRQAPLVESYLALADAPALTREARVNRGARQLRDSIAIIAAERERTAAQRGPDARYAALTARLTALGDRLAALADNVLRVSRDSLAAHLRVSSAGADSVVNNIAPAESASTDFAPSDSAVSDSVLQQAAQGTADSVAAIDRRLADARRVNDGLAKRRNALRASMQVQVPPVAMLLASLVVGVAAGFAVALWREVRRPRVGDAQELEQLTRSRVIVHRGRPRPDEAAPAALSLSAEAWPLLHLTLSNIGDVTRQVLVVADRPVLAGAVGLNLAAVAARESRATVLVDATPRAGALVPLLPARLLVRADVSAGALTASPGSWDATWDAARALPLGRDTQIALVLPRRARAAHEVAGAEAAVLAPLLRRFDFTVFVADTPKVAVASAGADLVLCARLGVTPLAWVARAVRAAEHQGRRIRAVVLWADEVPLAGSRASG